MVQFDLSEDCTAFLQDIVQSGVYASPSAAIEDALGLLRQRHKLRQAIEEGLESGFVPADEAVEHLRRRLAQLTEGR